MRAAVREMLDELKTWLPNYDSKSPEDFPVLVMRFLASLPGGEMAEDAGFEPFQSVAWHEADQLGRLLTVIEDKQDVEDLVRGLISENEE